MDIDLIQTKAILTTGGDMAGYLRGILDACPPDDPPFLSNLMTGANDGGLQVMEALEAYHLKNVERPLDQKFHWRLHVVRDEWGNVGLPGDIIYYREQKLLEWEPGKPLTSHDINMAKINGTYERDWIEVYEYEVDEKGCITLGFLHAARLLNLFGIHSRSGAVMSIHKDREHSADPVRTYKDGQKLHAWYWRYKEADRDYYAALPKLTPRDEKEDPRRGYEAA